jgi:hypothetical protein
MFIPNDTCLVERLKTYDVYGQAELSVISAKVPCAIVKLRVSRVKTSVRTDSSASGGNAHEQAADLRLLVDAKTDVAVGDKLTLRGMSFKVMDVLLRTGIRGDLEHLQVDGELWA